MPSNLAIEVHGLSKRYPLNRRFQDRVRLLLGWPIDPSQTFEALSDISFTLEKGRTLGVIGHNGSGKSTLLQILCGTLQPTSGKAKVNGRLSALLELGAGFNPEFSGVDNVLMLGATMGFDARQMQARLQPIFEFADIGEAIQQPVKTYSSGMFVRLAFAAAIHVDPDILVIDEALSVGDIAFQHKCINRIRQFMQTGTVLFVSHDLNAITSLCDEVIWLDRGRVREYGDPKQVSENYWAAMYAKINASEATQLAMEAGAAKKFPKAESGELQAVICDDGAIGKGFGDGRAQILGLDIRDQNGDHCHELRGGETLRVTFTFVARAAIPNPIVGVAIKNLTGGVVTGTNSDFEQRQIAGMSADTMLTVEFTMALPELAEGSYALTVAVADGLEDNHHMCHWIDDAWLLKVVAGRPVMGMMRLPVQLRVGEVIHVAATD